MKAFKTKSGKWWCRPVDHYEVINGKRRPVLASITRDSKDEALQAAYNYKRDRESERARGLTVEAAIRRYIELKRPVISPTTYKGYNSLLAHSYASIADLPITDLTNEILQAWVSEYSVTHTPKSVANAHGLLISALGMFLPNARFSVRLPQRKPPRLRIPTGEELRALLDYAAENDADLERAILLSAFGTFRRGEVCALMYEDVTYEGVNVDKSLVYVTGNKWVVKTPKMPDSIRTVKLPPEVIERVLRGLKPHERVIKITPAQITGHFSSAQKKLGIPHFRFHDLRAYAVSFRHAIGIPDQYIMQDGGYKTDTVMKAVYRRTMPDYAPEFSEKIRGHVQSIL